MWRERVVYEPAIEKPCYVIGGSQHAVIYVDDETAQIYYYHSITPTPSGSTRSGMWRIATF